MDENEPLDALFNSEAAQEQPAQAEPEQVVETPTKARDEHGRFAKGEEGASPAPVEEKPEPEFDHKAVIGERKRRQEAEAQLQALQEHLRQQQNPPEPPPSLWDDEQGWGQNLTNQAVHQAAIVSKLQTSELLTMQQHEDFADLKDQIFQFVGANPSVNEQVVASPHPWMVAYKAFKQDQNIKELGAVNVADLEAKIEARLREQMAAEKPAAAQPNLPQSLANAQSSRAATNAPQMLTLEDILGHK